MKSIWNALTQRLGQEDAMLVRIVHSQGSAPRHAGAQMAVFAHSQPEGTVGGGKVEAICLEHARTLLAQQRSNRQEYNLSGSGSNAIGMACGGQVTVDFLYLPAGEQSLQQVEQLAQQAPGGRVLVFGAGHVSRALAALLPALELDYLVVDDRPEFAQEQAFPGALAVHCMPMEGALAQLNPQPEDMIVVITRGHLHDYQVVCQALQSPAGYIGLMGSRRKIAILQQNLQQDGFAPEQFQRISTPIGLDIGAETPAEIAVSIAAQLIAHRAKGRTKSGWVQHLVHS